MAADARRQNDDYKRHKSDRTINNRTTLRLHDGEWQEVKWSQVQLGDTLKVLKDEPVPADIVVLSTSEAEGECYIETMDLDGETNLKRRSSVAATAGAQDEAGLRGLGGHVLCQPPNTSLEVFNGTMVQPGGEQHSLSNEELVLRGCVMRNTAYVHGLVVYAGFDSKLMMNSGANRYKRTRMDRTMGKMVISIFGVLIGLAIIGAIVNSAWLAEDGTGFTDAYNTRNSDEDWSNGTVSTLMFWSYIIILNTLVPISLIVSAEFIRLGQSLMINWDPEMKDPASGNHAQARTTTLNEELGQIVSRDAAAPRPAACRPPAPGLRILGQDGHAHV